MWNKKIKIRSGSKGYAVVTHQEWSKTVCAHYQKPVKKRHKVNIRKSVTLFIDLPAFLMLAGSHSHYD